MVRITLSSGETHDSELTLAEAMTAVDAGPWMEIAGRAVRTTHVVAIDDASDAEPADADPLDEEPLELPFGS